jgi:hypothetical protein
MARQPSKASIRAALLEGLFDPRDKSPMQVVVDLRDPTYCEMRAVELIMEARKIAPLAYDVTGSLDRQEEMKTEYREKVAQATSLLALARVLRDGA